MLQMDSIMLFWMKRPRKRLHVTLSDYTSGAAMTRPAPIFTTIFPTLTFGLHLVILFRCMYVSFYLVEFNKLAFMSWMTGMTRCITGTVVLYMSWINFIFFIIISYFNPRKLTYLHKFIDKDSLLSLSKYMWKSVNWLGLQLIVEMCSFVNNRFSLSQIKYRHFAKLFTIVI